MLHKEEPKWTLEEGLEDCAKMEKGIKHTSEDYTVKVGTIRPCHDCGKPVDVVSYTSYDLDHMSITSCDKHQHKFEKSNCASDTCPVHGGENGFDEDEYEKESNRIEQTRKDIREMFEKVKPKNDSIMEYDRMHSLFGHTHPHTKPDNYDYWLYNEFIDYFGLKGKLTL